ncbi:hypothetical protein CYMTET_43565 [Cymbomonas tetramitiformis]|uniref:Uncharacterized protein n=1 Tax=Cymbomonas tetramitiformis TaxID=36881 RepID=A0AAE0C3T9_9CHLO|nr:hypothetical protein CYMTET_43565 [Cymbomonas tetramitiformis]
MRGFQLLCSITLIHGQSVISDNPGTPSSLLPSFNTSNHGAVPPPDSADGHGKISPDSDPLNMELGASPGVLLHPPPSTFLPGPPWPSTPHSPVPPGTPWPGVPPPEYPKPSEPLIPPPPAPPRDPPSPSTPPAHFRQDLLPGVPAREPPKPPEPPIHLQAPSCSPNPISPPPPFIDPPYVAVGVYILNVGNDDAYQGKVDLDFLLYTKSFGILKSGLPLLRERAILPGGACAADTLQSKTEDWWSVHSHLHNGSAPPPPPYSTGPNRAFLANTHSTPSFEDCPKGATQAGNLQPAMGVACWRVQGTFTYKVDVANFPFDVQKFEIILEDESDGKGANYCLLHTISGLSSQIKATAEKMTWNIHRVSKCYPPIADCINGTVSKLTNQTVSLLTWIARSAVKHCCMLTALTAAPHVMIL